MSVEKYRDAMDHAWRIASIKFVADNAKRRDDVNMWLQIAAMELREPFKPVRPDAFNWAPPVDADPSVVGSRCSECRHFEDNHTDDGCRECGCEWVHRVAR